MGLTFKENCPDLRNSGIDSVIRELKRNHCNLDLYDPWTDKNEVKNLYGKYPLASLHKNSYDGIIISVAHDKFKSMGIKKITKLGKKNHIIYDLKYVFPLEEVDLRL